MISKDMESNREIQRVGLIIYATLVTLIAIQYGIHTTELKTQLEEEQMIRYEFSGIIDSLSNELEHNKIHTKELGDSVYANW